MESETEAVPWSRRAASKLLRHLVFLNWVQNPPLPRVPDLSDPSRFPWAQPGDEQPFEPTGVSHLFISSPMGSSDSSSRLGAWYLLPPQSSGRVEPLAVGDTVVLYLHGNAHNRAQPHRVALYRQLLSLGYYVLAVDYRGFGDSSPVELGEASVVADARAALHWVTSKLGDRARVVVWGHSLGTAVASHMVADWDLETGGDSPVSGLVLESPFNNMLEEVQTFRSSVLLSGLLDLAQLLKDTDVVFETDRWLPAVRCPVLLLHAEDDAVVPHSLGARLCQTARQAGKENVRMVSYPSSLSLGHCNIHLAPGLAEEVTDFVSSLESQGERAARLG